MKNRPQISVQLTTDGSHTIEVKELNITYHSKHGAIQESMHVFIEAGLLHWLDTTGKPAAGKAIHILEMGFGTGLNALLTLNTLNKLKPGSVYYEALETYPLDDIMTGQLNYCNEVSLQYLLPEFKKIHSCDWNRVVEIDDCLVLRKRNQSLLHVSLLPDFFDIVFFDAFAPGVQPELWTAEVFEKIYRSMTHNGILVSYCSKGDVRRALQSVGFKVEKIPGPPYKREMIRAVKV